MIYISMKWKVEEKYFLCSETKNVAAHIDKLRQHTDWAIWPKYFPSIGVEISAKCKSANL